MKGGMQRVIQMVMVLALCVLTQARGGVLPSGCTQVIVGVAKGWNDSHVHLNLLEKINGQWVSVAGPYDGRLGRSGLVWGLGLTMPPSGGTQKQEGDWRSPAGVFALGAVYSTVAQPEMNRKWAYRRVTPNDLWVEDVSSPHYNKHLVLSSPAATPWEKAQQMKQTDYPHSLKLFIRHNAVGDAGRPVRNAGSSIFFHIWRDGGKAPTAGCTTMSEPTLRALIRWLDPARVPVYILLPQEEYLKLRKAWGLP